MLPFPYKLVERLRTHADDLSDTTLRNTIIEAADALQALERVPMKDFEVIGATATVDATKDGWMMEIVRRIELFHGITPPESNDVLHTE